MDIVFVQLNKLTEFYILCFLLVWTIQNAEGQSTCRASNCGTNETCVGHCLRRKNVDYCHGQCVSKDPEEKCIDSYRYCKGWNHLCVNEAVAKICKRTCGGCNDNTTGPCDGFLCDGLCQPLTYQCDGVIDCSDGADELGCKYITDAWYNRNKKRRCGIRSSSANTNKPLVRNKRLVNGRYAVSHSWPWTGIILSHGVTSPIVAAQSKKLTFCGATLIHEDWALTAAHCVTNRGSIKGNNFIVTFGKHYLKGTDKEQVRNISRVLYFKDYNENGIYNDIALLKLNETVKLNEHVNIVCMPLTVDVRQFYKSGGVTTGWGFDEKGRISNRLKQTLVRPMDRSKCSREIFSFPFINIDPSLLCTELDDMFGVICDGDSGGPMVVRRKGGAYSLLGVSSFGTDKNCSRQGEASVYTNVYYFLPWIKHFVELTYV